MVDIFSLFDIDGDGDKDLSDSYLELELMDDDNEDYEDDE